MTYREEIQSLIEQMEKIYERAGMLRDYATLDEKEAWNDIRRMFYSATAAPLRKLDDSLSDDRASTIIQK